MFLKQATADIGVEAVGEEVIDVGGSLGNVVWIKNMQIGIDNHARHETQNERDYS